MSMADITTSVLILVLYLVSRVHIRGDLCGTVDKKHKDNRIAHCPTPWMVTICFKEAIFSGVIIDSIHIITAGHYHKNDIHVNGKPLTSEVVVIPGLVKTLNRSNCTANPGFKTVSHFDVKPSSKQYYGNYDLIILTLTSPITFNRCQRPICLMKRWKSLKKSRKCKLMSSRKIYRSNKIRFENEDFCFFIFDSYNAEDRSMFCTSQKKLGCQVEQGSALVCEEYDRKYYLSGIIDSTSNIKLYCRNDYYAYIKIYFYLHWINSIRLLNDKLCGTLDNTGTHGNNGLSNCPYPWMVTICKYKHLCSGTLIDSSNIITTAKCASYGDLKKDPSVFVYVIPGARETINKFNCGANPDARTVSQIVYYNKNTSLFGKNDIAIITLASPIKFNRCLRPICMIDSSKLVEEAQNCTVMTAGDAYEPQRTPLTPANSTNCSYILNMFYIKKKMFCTHEDNTECLLDGGNAFACQEPDGKYYLYGVMNTFTEVFCKNGLGLYARVSYYLQWINYYRL